jgi:hypothetical protein
MKYRKKIHLNFFIHFYFIFLFLPFIYLFLMWVCSICDPMVGGKKYYLHQIGEGNKKTIVVVVQ